MAAALTSSPRAGEGRNLACLCPNSEVSGPRREADPQALVRPWQSTQKRGYFVLLKCPNPISFDCGLLIPIRIDSLCFGGAWRRGPVGRIPRRATASRLEY